MFLSRGSIVELGPLIAAWLAPWPSLTILQPPEIGDGAGPDE
jgi:hypothetical protein